ncbi:MAG: type II toxin-antitoxin system VapC family toxin [Acidobacteriota bacterium]
MIVVDTDVLIDALRGRDPGAAKVRELLVGDGLATTAVIAFELCSGGRSEKQLQAIASLLAALTVIPFDTASMEAAASVRTQLESSGRGIGMADYLIAGCCVARRASLLTRNHQHFGRIAGLRLEPMAEG